MNGLAVWLLCIGGFIAGAEGTAPGVLSANVTLAARLYTMPSHLDQQLAAAIAANGGTP